MDKKNWVWLILVIILVIIGFLISKQSNDNLVKIGLVAPLSGPAASTGEILKEGLIWKIQQLKDNGQKIDLVIEDTQSDPKQAVNAFNKLTDINGISIIFTISSSAGMNLKPLAETKKVLLWGDITHPDFTASTTYVLRHSNIVNNDTSIMSEDIISTRPKKVGIIYQVDDFGKAYNQDLSAKLVASGLQVYSEGVDQKAGDFRTAITKLNGNNIDSLVVAVVGSGAGLIVKQSRELGYKGIIFQSVGFILTPEAQKIAGDYAAGIHYQTYLENSKFKNEYEDKFGKDPSILGSMGYTDIEILFDAITKTKSIDPLTLVSYIKNSGEFAGRFENVKINPNGDIIIPTIIEVWK